MRELGGYIEFEKYHGEEYYEKLLRFNTGRNSIVYALKARKYQKVYVPYYICDSVCNALVDAGIPFEYYQINRFFMPQLKKQIEKDACLLFINYYGQFTNEQILKIKEEFGNIIVDNTQSFFQKPAEGVDTVYTCRKYFGVPDGAYLSLDLGCREQLEQDTSYENMTHILGRFETTAAEYFAAHKKHEMILDKLPIRRMSKLTQNILKSIDYEKVQRIRTDNFKVLHESLSTFNELDIRNDAGLFMYPLLIPNGTAVKMKLIENKIYVPTLWPNVLSTDDKKSFEYYLADNLVLLPIDQRYRPDDMVDIISTLKRMEIFNFEGERTMQDLRDKRLLIMGGVKCAENIINAARKMGVYTIVTDYLEDSPAKKLADESHMVSTTDVDAVVKLAKELKVDGVFTSYIDSMMTYCQQVCEKLGFAFYATQEQIQITNEKRNFKQYCQRCGVPTVEEYSLDKINDEDSTVEYPLIVKPVDSSGGKGISVCYNKQEFVAAYEKALSFSASKQILIERYMTGDEVVIYYTMQDGYVSLSGMCDRYTNKEQDDVAQLPTSYIFPSRYLVDYQLNEDQKVRDMLRDLGLQNGVIFLQGFMENGECHFYEAGFRFAGAQEYKVISSVNGINTMDMMVTHALTGKMSGWDVSKHDNPNFKEYACKLSPLVRTGTISKIVGLDKIAEFPEVTDVASIYEDGDTIEGRGTLNQVSSRIFLKADTMADLALVIDRVYDTLKVLDENSENMLFGNFDTSILHENY